MLSVPLAFVVDLFGEVAVGKRRHPCRYTIQIPLKTLNTTYQLELAI